MQYFFDYQFDSTANDPNASKSANDHWIVLPLHDSFNSTDRLIFKSAANEHALDYMAFWRHQLSKQETISDDDLGLIFNAPAGAGGDYFLDYIQYTWRKANLAELVIIDGHQETVKIFNQINYCRQQKCAFLVKTDKPWRLLDGLKDETLPAVKDVKTRLAALPEISLNMPCTDHLAAALRYDFARRQINISPLLSDYIVQKMQRSFSAMVMIGQLLDHLSLQTGKAITKSMIDDIFKTYPELSV